MIYVLNTDHLSLKQRGHPKVGERIASLAPDEIAIAAVTAEEQMRGRLTFLHKAVGPQRIEGYRQLMKTIHMLSEVNVLDYDSSADRIFEELKRQNIRIGSQDLRIASVMLVHRGILVTRNYKDFEKVSNLKLENWSV